MLGSQVSGNPSAFDDDADDYYNASEIQVESVVDDEYITQVAENENIDDQDTSTSTNGRPLNFNKTVFPKVLRKAPSTPLLTSNF
ncbi:hypothetical protein GE061_017206 [Apolygus lucorum]|uniref:Uncharacterized protein n=1 Tax=Apolygus lucorum TaxID=248454 RepID=A0A8S9XAD0_APOLU|nr:hypothetical protein GE061_017206 [Apolygus lucorum]